MSAATYVASAYGVFVVLLVVYVVVISARMVRVQRQLRAFEDQDL